MPQPYWAEQTDNKKEEGQKFDSGKPQFHLIPPKAELEFVGVLTYGANKYSENNWRIVNRQKERYIAAALRHINAWRDGEVTDEESGFHHLAHAMCCLAFLTEVDIEKGWTGKTKTLTDK